MSLFMFNRFVASNIAFSKWWLLLHSLTVILISIVASYDVQVRFRPWKLLFANVPADYVCRRSSQYTPCHFKIVIFPKGEPGICFKYARGNIPDGQYFDWPMARWGFNDSDWKKFTTQYSKLSEIVLDVCYLYITGYVGPDRNVQFHIINDTRRTDINTYYDDNRLGFKMKYEILAPCIVQTRPHAVYDEKARTGQLKIDLDSSVSYKCADGFHGCINPEKNYLTCKLDTTHLHDTANHSGLLCEKKQCPSITTSSKVYVKAEIDTSLEVLCAKGKSLQAEPPFEVVQNLSCNCGKPENDDPVWQPAVRECSSEISCPPPTTAPANGQFLLNSGSLSSPKRVPHSQKATLVCDRGYKLNGTGAMIQCILNDQYNNATWSKVGSSCTEITCSQPPNPANGQFYINNVSMISLDTIPHSQSVKLVCNTGYKLNGTGETMECILNNDQYKNASWAKFGSTCKEITCSQPPTPANGQFYRSNGSLAHSERIPHSQSVKLVCNNGYKINGTGETMECILNDQYKNATWSKFGSTCLEITCSQPPSPANGQLYRNNVSLADSERIPHSKSVKLVCNNGYKINGTGETMECILNDQYKNATWTKFGSICKETINSSSTSSITNSSVAPKTSSGCAVQNQFLTKLHISVEVAKNIDLVEKSKQSMVALCLAVAQKSGCTNCQFTLLNLKQTYIPVLIDGLPTSLRTKRQSLSIEDLDKAISTFFKERPFPVDLTDKPHKADIVGEKPVDGGDTEKEDDDDLVPIAIIICVTILALAILIFVAFYLWTKRGSTVDTTEETTNLDDKQRPMKSMTIHTDTDKVITKMSAKMKDSTTISSGGVNQPETNVTKRETVTTSSRAKDDNTYVKVDPHKLIFPTIPTTETSTDINDAKDNEVDQHSESRKSKTLVTVTDTSTSQSGSKNTSSVNQLSTTKGYSLVKVPTTKYQNESEAIESGSMSEGLSKGKFSSNSTYDSIQPGGVIKMHKKKVIVKRHKTNNNSPSALVNKSKVTEII